MRWGLVGRRAAAMGLVLVLAGCSAPGAGVKPVGDGRAGAPSHGDATGRVAPSRVTAAHPVGDSADPLLAATAAYLGSPAAWADAWLIAYASRHPPDRYWSEPGGCAAWFAGAQPPEGGGGLLEGEPPAAPAFGSYVSALRLARLDLVFRRVRCGSDPDPGSLGERLRGAGRSWALLVGWAERHGLGVPLPDPPAPVLPPPPLVLEGDGPRTVLVRPPVGTAGEPFLLTATPGTTVTTLGPGGHQETLAGPGTHIVDETAGHRTTAVTVMAEGPWTLRLESFALMRRGSLPGVIRGRGADVVLVDVSLLGTARAAVVDGVADVTVHRSQQPPQPLAGRVPEADVVVLEITATGAWAVRTP